MKTILSTTQQILNALAFANAGNQREFEEMLSHSSRAVSPPAPDLQVVKSAVMKEEFHTLFPDHGVAA